ncbi:chemotaxis protein CheB [Dyadobacter arcticus]|uniref:protein-glutamate methylesterase n=1 Tax=Dyadobacter arcticus TaxID=1078754 RepID=A0ABX0UMR6_9BACT|nr:chemotaxis protein CheB [Dyadobacter arcticus]NIJ54303.1 two-component system chemotaxis response regulator CheB [Dyadobacter arcticus]
MEEDRLETSCQLLVIGGSAGSLDVLFKLLPRLKAGLTFPIVVILHRRNSVESFLAELLASKTVLPTREVDDKDPVVPGNIYLAPADYHLLIEKNRTFSLDYSEKVNFSRPSIDVTFESASEIYGKALVALILSGANEDGTQGMLCIQKRGGRTIAQKPESAQMPFMPQNAISRGAVNYILDIEQMSTFINELT